MDPNQLTERQRRALGDCLRALLKEVEHQRRQKTGSDDIHEDDPEPTQNGKSLRATPIPYKNTRAKHSKKPEKGRGDG